MSGNAPRLYGVIGDPIEHSLSPFIHNSWMSTHRIEAVYAPFHVKQGGFGSDLQGFLDLGVQGLNVTLPHKLSALQLSKASSDRAMDIGAANLLIREGDGWFADNSDADGFLTDLVRAVPDLETKNRSVLILGAGGAARAVVYALAGHDSLRVALSNRTLEKAEDIAEEFSLENALSLEMAVSTLDHFDIVINSTSMGHHGESITWPKGEGRLIYDLSYGSAADRFLLDPRKSGWETRDGLGMLVGQAAIAFEKWFGVRPDEEEMISACRKRIRA